MGPHSGENLSLRIIENHFIEPQNLKKSCWTKPIPAIVAVARPVRIATARAAHVPAAQKTAKTVHVPAARNNSTKMEEKKKKKDSTLSNNSAANLTVFLKKIQPLEPFSI